MPTLDSIKQQLRNLIASWKSKAVDGLTVAELVEFAREFVAEAMAIVNSLTDNAQKKALVLEASGLLFDFFAPKIVMALPWYLWFLAPFFRAQARQQFLSAVTVLIEVIFQAKFSPAAAQLLRQA